MKDKGLLIGSYDPVTNSWDTDDGPYTDEAMFLYIKRRYQEISKEYE